jgi:hypothetical protein
VIGFTVRRASARGSLAIVAGLLALGGCGQAQSSSPDLDRMMQRAQRDTRAVTDAIERAIKNGDPGEGRDIVQCVKQHPAHMAACVPR